MTVPTSQKFGVIVTDNAWRYANWSDKAHGAAKSHYPGLTCDELAAIPVKDFAADDCVMAMWVTGPKVEEAVDIYRAWGFEYVTWIPWVKFTPSTGNIYRGIGFWTMAAAEMLYICRRGNPKPKNRKDTPIGLLVEDLIEPEKRVFWAPRTTHSKKPEEIQDYLERRFDGPYLELFARRERPNWTCWGTDLGFELGPWGVRTCPKAITT